MADYVTVKLRGGAVTAKAIDDAGDRIDEGVVRALLRVAFKIMNAAKVMCPVQTGRLRASISINWTDSGMAFAKTETQGINMKKAAQMGNRPGVNDGASAPTRTDGFFIVVGTNVNYAKDVEERNSPYLYTAYAMFGPSFAASVSDEVRSALVLKGPGSKTVLEGNANVTLRPSRYDAGGLASWEKEYK